MSTSGTGTARSPAVLDIFGAALLGILVDGIIFLFSPRAANADSGVLPGWLIGLIWIGLFALMGAAHWLLRGPTPARRRARVGIILLLLCCAAYPFYTGMLRDRRLGLIGNVGTIVLSSVIVWLSSRVSRRASLLILPTPLWVLVATILTTTGRL